MLCLLLMTGCEKPVLDENGMYVEPTTQSSGSARIDITTRAAGDEVDNSITEGRIYIVNSAGTCVQMLSTDEESSAAATELAAGTYTIYAIGGSDLSRFVLPAQTAVNDNSLITRKSGKTMDDLLLKKTSVTLEDGDQRQMDIVLDRKVLCIDEVKITNVPTDVTKVEVVFETFYSAIRLNGTHPGLPTEAYKVALAKQSDGTTWKATPKQMLFPSKGIPDISVTLTSGSTLQAFTYPVSDVMQANSHFDITAAYSMEQGASLQCTLTSTDWDEDKSVTFNLDSDNQAVYVPVAETFCNGYYVVSVDETKRKAVLLSKTTLTYEEPASGSSASVWQAALAAAMATHPTPPGMTGSWRLPTIAEVRIFSKDTKVVTFGSSGGSANYFCLDGETLRWAYTLHSDSGDELKSGTANFSSIVHLRPVFDIQY